MSKRNQESYLEKVKCELKLESEQELARQRKRRGTKRQSPAGSNIC